MPALTLTLNRLVELFARSVNNDKLPVEIRSFSAKLMTLTAHVIRIDGGASKSFAAVNKQFAAINAQIAQLTEIVTVLAQKFGVEAPSAAPAAAPAAAPPTPARPVAQAATPAAPAAPAQAAPAVEDEADEDEEAAVAQLIAETQAEVDAINSNGVTAEVTQ